MLNDKYFHEESSRSFNNRVGRRTPKAKKRTSGVKDVNMRDLLPGYRPDQDSDEVLRIHDTVSSLQPFGF